MNALDREIARAEAEQRVYRGDALTVYADGYIDGLKRAKAIAQEPKWMRA